MKKSYMTSGLKFSYIICSMYNSVLDLTTRRARQASVEYDSYSNKKSEPGHVTVPNWNITEVKIRCPFDWKLEHAEPYN